MSMIGNYTNHLSYETMCYIISAQIILEQKKHPHQMKVLKIGELLLLIYSVSIQLVTDASVGNVLGAITITSSPFSFSKYF